MFDPFTDWTQDASYVNAVSTWLRHDHTFLTFQGALRLAGPPIGLIPAPPLTKARLERETDTLGHKSTSWSLSSRGIDLRTRASSLHETSAYFRHKVDTGVRNARKDEQKLESELLTSKLIINLWQIDEARGNRWSCEVSADSGMPPF